MESSTDDYLDDSMNNEDELRINERETVQDSSQNQEPRQNQIPEQESQNQRDVQDSQNQIPEQEPQTQRLEEESQNQMQRNSVNFSNPVDTFLMKKGKQNPELFIPEPAEKRGRIFLLLELDK